MFSKIKQVCYTTSLDLNRGFKLYYGKSTSINSFLWVWMILETYSKKNVWPYGWSKFCMYLPSWPIDHKKLNLWGSSKSPRSSDMETQERRIQGECRKSPRFALEIKYLGYMLTKCSIKLVQKKVQAILDLKFSTNLK